MSADLKKTSLLMLIDKLAAAV